MGHARDLSAAARLRTSELERARSSRGGEADPATHNMASLLHVFGSTFPAFGASLLLAVMVVASYTFAVALSAGSTGKPRTLQAARFGAYGTVALIAACVFCLAYAFVTHDFRIRYVAQHSDRSMPWWYLLTALWGGQDGSLLWWLFLLSLYTGACVKWLGSKYIELQPYVIATLMAIILFFCVVMVGAPWLPGSGANPFATGIAGAPSEGDGERVAGHHHDGQQHAAAEGGEGAAEDVE